MADWAKIAVKIVVVASIMAAIVALFNVIQIPELDYSAFDVIPTIIAVVEHYCPIMSIILPVAFGMVAEFMWVIRVKVKLYQWLTMSSACEKNIRIVK